MLDSPVAQEVVEGSRGEWRAVVGVPYIRYACEAKHCLNSSYGLLCRKRLPQVRDMLPPRVMVNDHEELPPAVLREVCGHDLERA